MRLEGQVAIVTGAGAGMGRSIAVALAKEGADIVVASVDRHSSGSHTADEINAMGRKGLAVKVDVSIRQEVEQLVSTALDAFQRIDILVNNAGFGITAHAEEMAEADWDRVVNVNLKGPFLCSQAVGREMIKRRSGKIVNIASTTAHRALPYLAAYTAAKAGVCQLTRALALEWARHNINVNTVSPGMTMTPYAERTVREQGDWVNLKDRIAAIPLQRANLPEDVANAVVFLTCPESGNITGQEIIVDGGTSCIHPYSGVALVLDSRRTT